MDIEIAEEMTTLSHRVATVIAITDTEVTFQHADGEIEINDRVELEEYYS